MEAAEIEASEGRPIPRRGRPSMNSVMRYGERAWSESRLAFPDWLTREAEARALVLRHPKGRVVKHGD